MVRPESLERMKAFLQHDQSGLLYQRDNTWVMEPQQALAFGNAEEAERFRRELHIDTAHAVLRIDPALYARSPRAPGAYQLGE
jgi:hypothetical protein